MKRWTVGQWGVVAWLVAFWAAAFLAIAAGVRGDWFAAVGYVMAAGGAVAAAGTMATLVRWQADEHDAAAVVAETGAEAWVSGYTQGIADAGARLIGVVAGALGPEDPLVDRMVRRLGGLGIGDDDPDDGAPRDW